MTAEIAEMRFLLERAGDAYIAARMPDDADRFYGEWLAREVGAPEQVDLWMRALQHAEAAFKAVAVAGEKRDPSDWRDFLAARMHEFLAANRP